MQSSHIVIPSNAGLYFVLVFRESHFLYLCLGNRDSTILVKSSVSASIGGLRNVVDRSSGSRVHGAFGGCMHVLYKCIYAHHDRPCKQASGGLQPPLPPPRRGAAASSPPPSPVISPMPTASRSHFSLAASISTEISIGYRNYGMGG